MATTNPRQTGTRGLSRRDLMRGGAAAVAFTIVPRHVLGGESAPAPSDKLGIAGIGLCGKGFSDLESVASQDIVALCDVDWRHAGGVFNRWPNAKRYKDYRVMLDTQKDIDAVIVATPDHTHAICSMAAIRRGKHCFCQKPLTHTVYEARKLAEAARAAKVATQMGNQGQAGEGARLVSEYIWSGSIGKVRAIHGWSNRRPDISPRGIPRPKDTPPVPANLNWDLWIGPAPMRPYHPCYHPFAWRGWWDFGTGVLGDIGCHNLSAAFKALKLGWPESVEACSTHWNAPPEIKDETAPAASIVTYRFAPEGDRPELTIQWYDGGMMPPLPREFGAKTIFADDGTLIVGDEGMLLNERLVPEARAREVGKPPQKLPRSPGHYKEWTDACKGGPPAGSNFVDHAGHLAAVVLLGNIAIRTQQKLFWDAEKLQFKDNPEANRLLQPPYRDGWSL